MFDHPVHGMQRAVEDLALYGEVIEVVVDLGFQMSCPRPDA